MLFKSSDHLLLPLHEKFAHTGMHSHRLHVTFRFGHLIHQHLPRKNRLQGQLSPILRWSNNLKSVRSGGGRVLFLCLFFVTTVVVFDNSSNSSLLFSTLLVLIRFFAFIHRCFRRAFHAFRTTSFFAVRHINHPSFFELRHHPVQIRRTEHLPFFVEHKKVELTEHPLQHTGIQVIHPRESPHTKRTTGCFIIVRFAQMRKKHHIDSERLRSVKFHHHPDNIVITQKIYL